MKDFDFRIWSKTTNQYLPENYSYVHNLLEPFNSDSEYYTIELGVGLFDKKGKKMYKGDILAVLDGSDSERPYYNYLEISYGQGRFYLKNSEAVEWDDILDDDHLDAEVVGNIHQIPDNLVKDYL